MELTMIGLGKMGTNMATRLLRGGHQVFVFDLNRTAVQHAEKEGGLALTDVAEIKTKQTSPRIVWVMVPSGAATEQTVNQLAELLDPNDIIIDGGNSNYKDTLRRAERLNEKKIHFVDVGTSGGVWGLKEGYSMMIGGEEEIVDKLRPIFETLAPATDKGWGYVGSNGSGHFVKMVHNGIEYGLMQAYAEGFDILKNKSDFNLDLHHIAKIWQHGSVIRSWLLDLTKEALATDQDLKAIKPWVSDSGEGRWTVADAIDLDVPAPVITMSLIMRFVSRQTDSYAAKLLSAMRNQFGGHDIKTKQA